MFLINRGELEGRLDTVFYKPLYFQNEKIIKASKWGYKKLNYLVKRLVDGPFGSDLKVEEYQPSGFPLLRVSNIRTGKVEGNLVFISDEKQQQLKRSKVYPNDVLLTKAGAILGYSAVFPESLKEGNITSHLVTITCNNEINPFYLSCYFKSVIGQLQIYRWGNKSTRPELNTSEVKNILVTLPPLGIQEKIVKKLNLAHQNKKQKLAEAQALLDSIDDYLLTELGIKRPEVVANTLKNRMFIRNSSEVSGGRFDPFYYQNEFEELEIKLKASIYPLEKLRNLPLFLESGSRPSGGVANIEKGILSFGGEHVNKKCEIEVKKKKYIPIKFHQNHLSTETKLNDILLVKDGATTGKIGIITDHNHVNQNINEHVFLIRFDSKVEPRYFVSLLNTGFYQSLLKRIITGATVTGLTKDVIRGLKIPLPPIEKQTEIANHIQALREQAKHLQQQAETEIKQAKIDVEKMILGDDNEL